MPYGPIHALSPAAWEQAAAWEKAGALNPVLRPADVYYGPDDERADPVAELRAAGLLARDERVTDNLFDLLPPLTVRASLEYVADFRVEDRKYTALAAAAGRGAAFAVRERNVDDAASDIVRAREIGEDELVDALLDMLALQPGQGSLVGMHVADAKRQADAVTERSLSWEHKQLRAVLERPVAGPAIEITIGVRDGTGQRSSIDDSPLHIAQLDWGHFVTYTTGSGDEQMYWAGPATDENVREALAVLRATLPAPN